MAPERSDNDEEKAVVDSNQRIAIITDVVADTAYVDPTRTSSPRT